MKSMFLTRGQTVGANLPLRYCKTHVVLQKKKLSSNGDIIMTSWIITVECYWLFARGEGICSWKTAFSVPRVGRVFYPLRGQPMRVPLWATKATYAAAEWWWVPQTALLHISAERRKVHRKLRRSLTRRSFWLLGLFCSQLMRHGSAPRRQ